MQRMNNAMKMVYKLLLITLIIFNVASFSGGFYPYDTSILNKDFYPDNIVLKYSIMSTLIVVMLIYVVYSFYFIWKSSDVDVLLSRA
jgi:hypothetical protein